MLTVSSFAEFVEIVSQHQPKWREWYYRGHTNSSFILVPKAGRPDGIENDEKAFEAWKLHAVSYLPSSPQELSDWDMLAIAQHHGLATRLLDWTFNALAAAYFALVEPSGVVDEKNDSAVFAHRSSKASVNTENVKRPFGLPESIVRVRPSAVAPRISRQGGIFTLHTPPSKDLEKELPKDDELVKIVISKACKKEFAVQLSHFGINRMSLFPDLDGLSSHINWSYKNLPYA